ncbi:nitroreductase [Kordiimonas marina]|uniref:nitroreductase n=1 Tax=Kordiimonas marina TaxID=2872312 RepID=UPI001FF5E7D5|nr:nitroreductase [Kordiimonas marina]MCJ9428617.1 nitroreductase [Kordiimonas marina]
MTSVTEAVRGRHSIRAFKDTPVPLEVVREILDIARYAPSGGNLQPWIVHALTGDALSDLLGRVFKVLSENPMGEGGDYSPYPEALWEPYRSRRFKNGEDLYATIGIGRDNKPARLMQFSRNFGFFGAPVGLFFCIDRGMGRPQWAHMGMFMQTVMLLAQERGLATCAQEAWSVLPKTVGDFLKLPEDQMLYAGMALGYADEDAPINSLRTDRVEVDDFTSFHGF